MTGRWAAVIGAALCACGGTLFVDPNPPRLRTAVAQYTTHAVVEPLVYVTLLDLFVEDPGTCDVAKSWFLAVTQRAMQGLTPDQSQLTRDLAPRCTQREGIVLDVEGLVAEVRSIALSHPQAHLRPVLLYANGLDLPVPPARRQSLATLAASLTALGMPPLVWLVASKPVAGQLTSDHAQDWTYAGDPAVATEMAAFAQLSLPFQTEAGTDSGPQPLLNGPDLERVREIKLCSSDSTASLTGLPQPGIAVRVDRSVPPVWQITLPPQIASTKAAFLPHTVTAKLELCDGNCDRYYNVDPDQVQRGWDVITGCLLKESR